jgi:hypothetical protein
MFHIYPRSSSFLTFLRNPTFNKITNCRPNFLNKTRENKFCTNKFKHLDLVNLCKNQQISSRFNINKKEMTSIMNHDIIKNDKKMILKSLGFPLTLRWYHYALIFNTGNILSHVLTSVSTHGDYDGIILLVIFVTIPLWLPFCLISECIPFAFSLSLITTPMLMPLIFKENESCINKIYHEIIIHNPIAVSYITQIDLPLFEYLVNRMDNITCNLDIDSLIKNNRDFFSNYKNHCIGILNKKLQNLLPGQCGYYNVSQLKTNIENMVN